MWWTQDIFEYTIHCPQRIRSRLESHIQGRKVNTRVFGSHSSRKPMDECIIWVGNNKLGAFRDPENLASTTEELLEGLPLSPLDVFE